MKEETIKDKSFEEWSSEVQHTTARNEQKLKELQQELEKRLAEIDRKMEYYDKIIAYYKMLYNNQERNDATLAQREA